MKLATIALAAAFALSSTFALAATKHHKSGARTQQRAVGMNPTAYRGSMDYYGRNNPGWNNSGWNSGGWNNNGWNPGGVGPNNRGGLVGGSDTGTFRQ
jgi:hypothetical protein